MTLMNGSGVWRARRAVARTTRTRGFTPETWQVDWLETTRDRQGIVKGQPFRMRSLVTIYVVEPTPETSEEQVRNNPLGIYVRDFSWSKQL